jgi:hypothetical protein
MRRLILRLNQHKSMSCDLLTDDWQPVLADLVATQRRLLPERRIEEVQIASYDREFRDRFRYRAVPVNLDQLNSEPAAESELQAA